MIIFIVEYQIPNSAQGSFSIQPELGGLGVLHWNKSLRNVSISSKYLDHRIVFRFRLCLCLCVCVSTSVSNLTTVRSLAVSNGRLDVEPLSGPCLKGRVGSLPWSGRSRNIGDLDTPLARDDNFGGSPSRNNTAGIA